MSPRRGQTGRIHVLDRVSPIIEMEGCADPREQRLSWRDFGLETPHKFFLGMAQSSLVVLQIGRILRQARKGQNGTSLNGLPTPRNEGPAKRGGNQGKSERQAAEVKGTRQPLRQRRRQQDGDHGCPEQDRNGVAQVGIVAGHGHSHHLDKN